MLKNSISATTHLKIPDLNKPFVISTDASNTGLGAVLLQEHEDQLYPCWFASRGLKPAETRYSVSEKECLAVIWAIEKFRGFIEYTNFTIETDHAALSWLLNTKDPAGRLARWFMTLQQYDFNVVYRPGSSIRMKAADALSRVHTVAIVTIDTSEREPIDRNAMIKAQANDEQLSSLVKYLNEPN
ncbi:unnamed protein product, partial [Allacma fusca]